MKVVIGDIVGVLEKRGTTRVALILHGTLGHKDYLFQKRLALALPIDSFRFDFRGSHESGGAFRYGGLESDVEDIDTVVEYLKAQGYTIDLIVGHSRGSIAGMRWMCLKGYDVKGFVNVSARYRMEKIRGMVLFSVLMQISTGRVPPSMPQLLGSL